MTIETTCDPAACAEPTRQTAQGLRCERCDRYRGRPVALAEAAARRLTDEVKADAARLWIKLARLYHGGAHTALGYSSWGAYYEAEFGQSARTGYRLLEAARVAEALSDTHVTGGEEASAPSQNAARELAPVLREDGDVEGVWREVVETHGPEPTAAETRAVVEERAWGPPEGFCLKRDREGVECGKPALPGRAVCDGHAKHDVLRKFGARSRRFEQARREAVRELVELGWSADFAAGKVKEEYVKASEALDFERAAI